MIDINKTGVLVFYHADCPDGFTAAWVAWRKFKDEAQYIPVNLSSPVPAEVDDISGKTIYFLDCSYPEEIISSLSKNNDVYIIDHHKSNKERFEIIRKGLFSMDHSGATLAWLFFNNTEPIPKLCQYIEDRDIWAWKLDKSAEICASIDLYDFNFETWDIIAKELEEESGFDFHYKQGMVVVKYENKIVDRIIKSNSTLVEFEGHKIYAVNGPHILASLIGEKLYISKPSMAIIWNFNKNGISVSLRSDGSVDVSEIAKKYGGGGHRASSGFAVKNSFIFPWKIIEND